VRTARDSALQGRRPEGLRGPPGRREARAARPDTPAGGRELPPEGRETSPAGRESATAGLETSPEERESNPAGRETDTGKRETSPAGPETPTGKRETSPAGRETSPEERESNPAGRETDTGKRESSPAGRESSPKGRETYPEERESSPEGRGTAPEGPRTGSAGREIGPVRARGAKSRKENEMGDNYIPRNDAEFDHWFTNLLAYVDAKTSGASPAWPDVPAAQSDALHAAQLDWHRHYEPVLQPHTPGQTAAKNDARARAETAIRPFVQRFLHWPPVTNADRVNMGIPNRDRIRTPHEEVAERVELELSVRNAREVVASFRVKGSPARAKPKGYDGAVLVWATLPAPPASHAELTNHAMASRTPHALSFDETDRGRTVYVAAAWQNERGNVGAWCDIASAIVP